MRNEVVITSALQAEEGPEEDQLGLVPAPRWTEIWMSCGYLNGAYRVYCACGLEACLVFEALG